MNTTILCIAGRKMASGATTTAVSLAHGLSLRGQRVLLIDLNPEGRCATMLGLNPEPGAFHLLTEGKAVENNTVLKSWIRFSGRHGLHLLPGDRTTLKAQALWSDLQPPAFSLRQCIQHSFHTAWQAIVINTSPLLPELQEQAIRACDLLILPTKTEFEVVDGLAQSLHRLSLLQEQGNWQGYLLGILPTFYEEHARESKAALETLRERFGESVLHPVQSSVLLEKCTATGWTIFETDPLCRATKEYMLLTRLVMQVMGGH